MPLGNNKYIGWTEPCQHLSCSDKDEIKRAKETGDDGFYFEEEQKYSSIYIYRPGHGFQRKNTRSRASTSGLRSSPRRLRMMGAREDIEYSLKVDSVNFPLVFG